MDAGTIGLTLLMAVKEKEARVIITDLFDAKLKYTKRFGADYVVLDAFPVSQIQEGES